VRHQQLSVVSSVEDVVAVYQAAVLGLLEFSPRELEDGLCDDGVTGDASYIGFD